MDYSERFGAILHGAALGFIISSPMILLAIYAIKDWLRAYGY